MPFSARVLVLDADPARPLNIGDKLGARGYRALHADSVDAAKSIASSALLDVAIINTPTKESNGTDVIEALKESWRGEHMPLIVVSEDVELERKSLESAEGMADFRPRSFKEIELFSRLTSLVRLNTMQRELSRRHDTASKFGVEGPRHVDPPGGLTQRNILILARQPADAQALRRIYPAQARVTLLADSFEALDFLLLNKFVDAVVVSVGAKPDPDYVQFCADLRRNSRLFNMPMLLVADCGADADALYSAGASEVLLRPLQTADLLFRTETLVRQNLYRLALRSVFREVRDPMTSDGLTGLYSYGFLYEHLSALIDDAKECEKNLSVGFFDMEGIAHVNRTNGYVAGDKVLRQIGSLIGNLVRGEDLVARHGGDQFCVLMPGTTLSEAEIVLRRIAGIVTNTEYAVREAQDPVQVTMKAGYAAFEDGDDAEGLVARAPPLHHLISSRSCVPASFPRDADRVYDRGMQINIISDTICPWCFVGKRRLEAAVAQRPNLALEVSWHPFQLNPGTPIDGMDRAAYIQAKFGSSSYPQQMLSALNAAGESVGIDFDFGAMARVPNTIRSHCLIRWAGEADVQDAVVNILFDRYFLQQGDIGDPDLLAEVAAEAGMDGDEVRLRLDRGDDADVVAAEDAHVRNLGISGVPTFILDQKYAVTGAQEPQVLLQVFDKGAAAAAGVPA